MKFSTPEPIRIPEMWKLKLAKTNLNADEKDDCKTINGEICEGIGFTLYLNSDHRHYWLDVTVDDKINDVFYDSEGTANLVLAESVTVQTDEHAYTIDINFV